MARMPADPLAPLPPLPPARRDGRGPRPGLRRDVRGRGLRHPLPFGARAGRGRADALMDAVEKAVDRLAGLQAPGLRRVAARLERIPDRLDERLALQRARAVADEEGLFGRAERDGADGVVITLFERPLTESADPADLEEAVYAVALSRCAAALGVDPQVLDPSWGRA